MRIIRTGQDVAQRVVRAVNGSVLIKRDAPGPFPVNRSPVVPYTGIAPGLWLLGTGSMDRNGETDLQSEINLRDTGDGPFTVVGREYVLRFTATGLAGDPTEVRMGGVKREVVEGVNIYEITATTAEGIEFYPVTGGLAGSGVFTGFLVLEREA